MPAPESGHGAAWLKAAASPWFDPQDPPAPPQSRRDTMPTGLTAERILTIQQAGDDRQTPRRRQIPIDRTARTAAPNPPAGSSPEASRTPADRVRGTGPATAGVREPFTTADSGGYPQFRPLLGVKRKSISGG